MPALLLLSLGTKAHVGHSPELTWELNFGHNHLAAEAIRLADETIRIYIIIV